jgi:hypothetical protein
MDFHGLESSRTLIPGTAVGSIQPFAYIEDAQTILLN